MNHQTPPQRADLASAATLTLPSTQNASCAPSSARPGSDPGTKRAVVTRDPRRGLLGIDDHRLTPAWLLCMIEAGILEEVSKGSGFKASRNRYLPAGVSQQVQ